MRRRLGLVILLMAVPLRRGVVRGRPLKEKNLFNLKTKQKIRRPSNSRGGGEVRPLKKIYFLFLRLPLPVFETWKERWYRGGIQAGRTSELQRYAANH